MKTIVSAFFSDINKREDRDINKYYELGKLLLKSDIPKIIFVDSIMYELIKNEENDNTKIILSDIKTLYFYNYELNNFHLNTNNMNKDTLDYMFMMCSKTEWIRQAIHINPFKTDHFIWLDFGIRHVFKCSDDEFITKINNMWCAQFKSAEGTFDLSQPSLVKEETHIKYKTYDKIRIGHIWDLNYISDRDIYKEISWYFAGGVFGGNINNLILFADMVKDKCIDIMINRKTIMWEVNIWYLVYKYNTNIFDPYHCDHNDSICDNY